MPVRLIDVNSPITVVVGSEKNLTTVVFKPLTIGDKMKLGGIVDTDKIFRTDVAAMSEIVARNLVSVEGINEPITPEVIQRIDDLSVFWEIAGQMVARSSMNESDEGN